MNDRPNPHGVLAHLHHQEEQAEAAQHDDGEHLGLGDHQHLDVDDHQHLDDPAVHRPESPVVGPSTPVPTPPATGHREHHHEPYDRGAVPWSAPPANSLFADLAGPVTTAGSLFTDPRSS